MSREWSRCAWTHICSQGLFSPWESYQVNHRLTPCVSSFSSYMISITNSLWLCILLLSVIFTCSCWSFQVHTLWLYFFTCLYQQNNDICSFYDKLHTLERAHGVGDDQIRAWTSDHPLTMERKALMSGSVNAALVEYQKHCKHCRKDVCKSTKSDLHATIGGGGWFSK